MAGRPASPGGWLRLHLCALLPRQRLTVVARVFSATICYGADAAACIEALPSLGGQVRRCLREPGLGVKIEDDDDDGGDDAKSSIFVPPPRSHAGRDTDLTMDQFALLVGSPDYTMQMSGAKYVASGTSVRCIVLGEMYVFVTCCVDEERGYYKRLGCTGGIDTIGREGDHTCLTCHRSIGMNNGDIKGQTSFRA